MMKRRDVLKAGLAAGALAACGPGRPTQTEKPVAKKTILILGGTGFLGPHIVEAARARGHTLTLFNRGKSHPGMFPDLEQLLGDRDGKLDALVGRRWDAVVDTSGYVPRLVKASAELLKESGQYVFVSSISAYADPVAPHTDEGAPVARLPPEAAGSEDVKLYYGALKAECEAAAEAAMPGRVTNIRPGLIAGPLDPTDRFTYWPVRVAKGGEVLAPGDGSAPGQFIDARDLGAWIVRCIEQGTVGVFNAVGPATTMTMQVLLDACKTAAPGSDATFTWVDEKFLEAQQVAPWMELTVWTGSELGFATVNAGKAIAAGLVFRPVVDTARDTLAWWNAEPEERRAAPKAGLQPDKEAAVLAAWRART